MSTPEDIATPAAPAAPPASPPATPSAPPAATASPASGTAVKPAPAAGRPSLVSRLLGWLPSHLHAVILVIAGMLFLVAIMLATR